MKVVTEISKKLLNFCADADKVTGTAILGI